MRRRRAPMAGPVAVAREVLTSRGITEPEQIDLPAILADHRLVLRRARLANAEGRLVRSGRHGVVTIDESAFQSEKWRFVGAHELGHHRLHEHRAELACFPKVGATREERSRSFLDEQGASDFAVELLTPAAMVAAHDEVRASPAARARAIAQGFGVSLPVAALRVLDFTKEPCAVAYAEAGQVLWCTATRGFAVKVKEPMEVPGESCAARVGAGKGAARVVGASVWGEARGVAEVWEEAMGIAGFDAVVTVLWHGEVVEKAKPRRARAMAR